MWSVTENFHWSCHQITVGVRMNAWTARLALNHNIWRGVGKQPSNRSPSVNATSHKPTGEIPQTIKSHSSDRYRGFLCHPVDRNPIPTFQIDVSQLISVTSCLMGRFRDLSFKVIKANAVFLNNGIVRHHWVEHHCVMGYELCLLCSGSDLVRLSPFSGRRFPLSSFNLDSNISKLR